MYVDKMITTYKSASSTSVAFFSEILYYYKKGNDTLEFAPKIDIPHFSLLGHTLSMYAFFPFLILETT